METRCEIREIPVGGKFRYDGERCEYVVLRQFPADEDSPPRAEIQAVLKPTMGKPRTVVAGKYELVWPVKA